MVQAAGGGTGGRGLLPVLAVDLIGREGVVKHQHFVVVLQPRSGVVLVLQSNRSVQQGQVPSDNQGVRTVCGHNDDTVTA